VSLGDGDPERGEAQSRDIDEQASSERDELGEY